MTGPTGDVVRWRCTDCGRYVRTATVDDVITLGNGVMVGTGECDGDPQVVTEADRKATS